MCKILECNRVSLYLNVFAKILQKDVKKDQNMHMCDTGDCTTHEKSSEEKNLISKPKTTKIFMRMQKRKKKWDVPEVESKK